MTHNTVPYLPCCLQHGMMAPATVPHFSHPLGITPRFTAALHPQIQTHFFSQSSEVNSEPALPQEAPQKPQLHLPQVNLTLDPSWCQSPKRDELGVTMSAILPITAFIQAITKSCHLGLFKVFKLTLAGSSALTTSFSSACCHQLCPDVSQSSLG